MTDNKITNLSGLRNINQLNENGLHSRSLELLLSIVRIIRIWNVIQLTFEVYDKSPIKSINSQPLWRKEISLVTETQGKI